MTMVRSCICVLLLAMLPHAIEAKALPLASGGRTSYAIDAAPDRHAYAVAELKRYFQLITGAELATDAGRDRRIIFTAGTELGQRLDADAYVLLSRGDDIVIAADSDRAALFAVYDLLERLGCRWLAPQFAFYDGQAEIVPKTRELSVDLPAEIVVQKPAFALRKLDVAEGLSHDATNLQQLIEWMPKARFNTLVVPSRFGAGGRVQWDKWREAMTPEIGKRGLILEVGGHGYQNYLAADMPAPDGTGTMFDVHPEWFGIDEKGQRRKLKSRVFCTSNPEAVAFLTGNVLQYVKERSEIDIFDFWPPDGADWCTCDDCAALGDPQDRQALLANHVLAAMTDAGLPTRLEIIAYSEALLPPQRVKLDPRILVDFCPINQCFEVPIDNPSSSRNVEYVQAVRAWREQFDGDIGLYSYYRKYAWRSAPAVIPHYISQDLRFYRSLPLQAVHVYAEPAGGHTSSITMRWGSSAGIRRRMSMASSASSRQRATVMRRWARR